MTFRAAQVRPGVQRVLDALVDAPAFVRNGRFDVLAANRLGRALYAPVFEQTTRPPNSARFTFLDPRAEAFFANWERAANDAVAILHSEAGRYPYEPALTELIGELSSKHHGVHTAGWMITATTLTAGVLLVSMAHTRPVTTPAGNSSPPLEPVTVPA